MKLMNKSDRETVVKVLKLLAFVVVRLIEIYY